MNFFKQKNLIKEKDTANANTHTHTHTHVFGLKSIMSWYDTCIIIVRIVELSWSLYLIANVRSQIEICL